MNIGFYSARTGLLSMQQGLDVISNNMANSETTGFKALRPNFSDMLYTVQKPQIPEAQTGHGTRISKTDIMYERGQLLLTNRPLDFTTPTDGFFAVSDGTGETAYTKDGAFYVSRNDGSPDTLVNADGKSVLGFDGKPITIDYANGSDIDTEKLMSKIGVFRFDNPYGLEAKGSNTYITTASSGDAIPDTGLAKLNGALEMSTVNVADQMVKVIQYQRAFSLNSKMVQTSDEIEQIVNNLR